VTGETGEAFASPVVVQAQPAPPVIPLLSLGPEDPSFRALSGHLKFTARRHLFNSPSSRPAVPELRSAAGGSIASHT